MTLTVEPAESAVSVAGAAIRTLPADDFPAIETAFDFAGEIPADAFKIGADSVEPASSRDAARPVLTGVLLELAGHPGARMVATDSYRLHIADIAGRGDLAAIIPGAVIKSIGRAIGRKPAGTVTIAVAGRDQRGDVDAVRFKLPNGVEVTTRTIAGEYPNYRQLIPERGTGTGVRYGPELADAVKAGAPFAGDTGPIRCAFDSVFGAKLSASSADLGDWSRELAGVEVWGESVTVALNPGYLLGGIGAVGAGATVEVRDGLKPAVFRSADGRRIALVMPVRMPTPVE